jgi:hypothetical protein
MSQNDANLSLEQTLKKPEPKEQPSKLVVVSSSNDIDGLLSQLINLNQDNIIHESTCLICSNPDRSEIENKYNRKDKVEDILKFIEDKYKTKIHSSVLENHMVYHYERQIQELRKREYVDKIKRVTGSELTTLDRISLCFAALSERLVNINSVLPNIDAGHVEIEQIKTTETVKVMNAFSQLLKLQATILGEMKNSGQLIVLPREAFINIFNEIIIESKSSEQKEIVKKILDRLLTLSKSVQ